MDAMKSFVLLLLLLLSSDWTGTGMGMGMGVPGDDSIISWESKSEWPSGIKNRYLYPIPNTYNLVLNGA